LISCMGLTECLANFKGQGEGIQGFNQEGLNTGYESRDPGFFLSTPRTQDNGQVGTQASDPLNQVKPSRPGPFHYL